MATTLSMPLSKALQESTAMAHDRAENATFITHLMSGGGTPDGMVALLRQSLPVYEALEESCRAVASDPRIAPILDPALDRTDALRADLATHRGEGRTCDIVVPTTEVYAAELRALAADPVSLVGHHYVRYLGDLSGGQIIKTMVRRHYGLETGLSFYDFDIPKPKVYKDRYRAALDALPLSDLERETALVAATRAFELNQQLFIDLAAVDIH